MTYLATVTDKHSVNNDTNKQSDLGDGVLALAQGTEELVGSQLPAEWF